MTLVLDLPPELGARLRAEAARQGTTPEELAVRIIREALAQDEETRTTDDEKLSKRTHAGL